jgi:sulfoquinovose isomerase
VGRGGLRARAGCGHGRALDPPQGWGAWRLWLVVIAHGFADDTKLAYGHVFVLLAAASALSVGHDAAPRLLADIDAVIDRHFWDDSAGRLREEYRADWQGFSTYRGMNANMHGTEAFLAAFEATGQAKYLDRAGRILDFFTGQMAAQHHNRIPEHYTESWQVDPAYHGNPMFRPAGTTPGHALEFARLLVQYWDLSGRSDATAVAARPRAGGNRAVGCVAGRRGAGLYCGRRRAGIGQQPLLVAGD